MKYEFDFASVLARWPLFLEGAWTTVQLSFLATVLGFVLGALCAVGRGSRYGWLRRARKSTAWCRHCPHGMRLARDPVAQGVVEAHRPCSLVSTSCAAALFTSTSVPSICM